MEELNKQLTESKFDPELTRKLILGFSQGFQIGYHGNRHIKQTANNLRFSVGNKTILWNKVMKEVMNKRYAGPFKSVPFKYYIQSPIGLVPKDGGRDTRLIFHLSHPRREKGELQESVNGNTVAEECSVKYPDFDDAVRLCLHHGVNCYAGKSDFKSAFRNLGMRKEDWCLLVMKAESPLDQQTYFFFDKCLPFGGSISCAHFQLFSDAVAHIFTHATGRRVVNYLDDFLFVGKTKKECNDQMHTFLSICRAIGFPVSMEKTYWASQNIVFLGIMMDTRTQKVYLALEKIEKAKSLIYKLITKKKGEILEIQRLCGLLNFFAKCIIPARAFTRRIYSNTRNYNLKPRHHVGIKPETVMDLTLWLQFLNSQQFYNRPFTDFSKTLTARDIQFYTDSSGKIGCGGYCGTAWFAAQWDKQFLRENNPSIEYLELYAVAVGVLNWLGNYPNSSICLYCDNRSVVDMLNSTSSSCSNCMILIRLIVLEGLRCNTKITARHVVGRDNLIADCLSRAKFRELQHIAKFRTFEKWSTPLPQTIWPVQKIWLTEK